MLFDLLLFPELRLFDFFDAEPFFDELLPDFAFEDDDDFFDGAASPVEANAPKQNIAASGNPNLMIFSTQ